ncbi:MAG: hypothetical protein GY953_41840, partial [bacterium]|nr:hypothetical protein [bacterium]
MIRLLYLWLFVGAALCQVPHERPAWFIGEQPYFLNGFLHYHGPPTAEFNAALYDRGGGLLFETLIETPDNELANILDWAAFPDGASVAAVRLGAGTRAGLLLLGGDGKAQRFVETYPFVPHHLTITSDGAIWTLGMEANPIQPDRPADTNFEVFRKFSREGEVLRKRFRRSEFPADKAPWDRATLLAAKESFGVFVASEGEWIEFSNDGGLRGTPATGLLRTGDPASLGPPRYCAAAH